MEIRVPETAVRHLCREEDVGGSDCLLCMRQVTDISLLTS